MAGSSETLEEALAAEIEAHARRYELADRAAAALQGLSRLVDWGEPNFVPKWESSTRRRDRRRPDDRQRRIASNTLAESLAGLELEPVRKARRLADIGSGAGFPGLVLAIALPDARVTLIEKVSEKGEFLRGAIEELGLDNVEVADVHVKKWKEGAGACDVVTSRKVGPAKTMIELSAPLLVAGGAIVLYPGRTGLEEETLPAADEAAQALGMGRAQVLPVAYARRRGGTTEKHLYLYM